MSGAPAHGGAACDATRSGYVAPSDHCPPRSRRYETDANPLNQVVVWDQIISDQSQAWIRSSSVANKYSLTDQGYGLRANNVTLVLNWNTVPSTGLLLLHHGHGSSQLHHFDVPDTYS